MKSILIAGGSGLIGSALSQHLSANGYNVYVLTRNKSLTKIPKFLFWDPKGGIIDPRALEIPVVINLAGANVSTGRWTKKRKQILRDSRIKTTAFLSQSLKPANLDLYIGASAIGYYGNSDSNNFYENSDCGNDFLAILSSDWEGAHKSFLAVTPNVKIARIGIVLSPSGGALPKMSLPFNFGLGPYFGSGKQYYSWIHIADVCHAIQFLIERKTNHSVFNLVSPNPLTAKEFNVSIKSAKKKFAFIHSIPSPFVKLIFGEQASILLNSTRVQPAALLKNGFHFSHPELVEALRSLWKK